MQLADSSDAAFTTLAHVGAPHAPAWLLVLLLVLTEAGALTWALRQMKRSRTDALPGAPDLALGKYVFGGAVVAAASAAFMGIAFVVGSGGAFVHVETAVSAAVHGMTTSGAQQAFGVLTHLGDGLALTLLCIATAIFLLWRNERVLALGLVVAIGGNGLLNAALKRSFVRPRPPHEAGMPIFHGWGFPSGHASGSVVTFGILAYVLMRTLPKAWHMPVTLLAAAAVFLVGASRLILEAHYAGDVLAGFASGTAWLAACILSLEMFRDLAPSQPTRG